MNVTSLYHSKFSINQHVVPSSSICPIEKVELLYAAFPTDWVENVQDFFEGLITCDEINLSKENARAYLTIIKIKDLQTCFRFSTYNLRSHILLLCAPHMTTSEAFTKTLYAYNFNNRNYLSNPKNWIAERVKCHLHIVFSQKILAHKVSTLLNNHTPTLLAIRGNVASGKSTIIKTDSYFHKVLNDSKEIPGLLDPDVFKYYLKNKTYINNQVHEEGICLFHRFKKDLALESPAISILLEGRLSTLDEVENQVLKVARITNREVILLDLDSSFEASLLRVLCRTPFGKDPCVPLNAIIEGHIQSRAHRMNLIQTIKTNEIIKKYKLFVRDSEGVNHLAAEKQGLEFIVYSDSLFKESLIVPSLKEISNQVEKIITEDVLDMAINRHDINCCYRPSLEKWIGLSFSNALEIHTNLITNL